ncbi:hypothetical protein [Moraxella lacunata]|nr:hypothetical protein [Moraxella lacunata]
MARYERFSLIVSFAENLYKEKPISNPTDDYNKNFWQICHQKPPNLLQ